jgi:hypothetical protein
MRSAGIEIKEALCFVNGTVAFAVLGLLLAFVGGTFVTKVNAFFLAMAHRSSPSMAAKGRGAATYVGLGLPPPLFWGMTDLWM